MVLVLASFLYAYFFDPAAIDEEAVEEVEAESPEDRREVLLEHDREVAEAARADIEDGYSGQ